MNTSYQTPSLSTIMGKLENNHKREKKIDGILPFLSYNEIKNLALTERQILFDIQISKFKTWPKFAKDREIDSYNYIHKNNPACILRCPSRGGLCSCCGCHSFDYKPTDLRSDVIIYGSLSSESCEPFNWVNNPRRSGGAQGPRPEKSDCKICNQYFNSSCEGCIKIDLYKMRSIYEYNKNYLIHMLKLIISGSRYYNDMNEDIDITDAMIYEARKSIYIQNQYRDIIYMLKFHEHIDNPTKGQIEAEFLKDNYLALIDEKLYNEDNFVRNVKNRI